MLAISFNRPSKNYYERSLSVLLLDVNKQCQTHYKFHKQLLCRLNPPPPNSAQFIIFVRLYQLRVAHVRQWTKMSLCLCNNPFVLLSPPLLYPPYGRSSCMVLQASSERDSSALLQCLNRGHFNPEEMLCVQLTAYCLRQIPGQRAGEEASWSGGKQRTQHRSCSLRFKNIFS